METTFRTINIERAMKYVNELLIPLENYYYHEYNHALDVMERSIYLGKKEGLNDVEIELLAIAALFHDTGFIIQYDDNEYIGAKIARNYLKSMLYPEDKIKIVEDIILASSIEYKKPKNIYEKIIKDADLDNLWRDDFLNKSIDLRKELEIIKNIKFKDPKWLHWSINFLANSKYFTKTEKNERDEMKKINKNILKKMKKEEKKVNNYYK